MANYIIMLHSLLPILLLPLLQTPVIAVHKHYIVYLGSHDGGGRLLGNPESVTKSHHQLISLVSKRNDNDPDLSKKLIYSFTKIFNAFAATLQEKEAEELAKHPDVISIFESRDVSMQTSHSWDFLGSFQNQMNYTTNESVWEKANYGEDIIIANVDTGVWPESKSFSDEGFGPIPKKFKGRCDNEIDPTFKCNKKLIGARFFHKGLAKSAASNNVTFPKIPSLRDMKGHGTHTLSTAGGNVVPNLNITFLRKLGLNNVTVKGGSPRSRVVAYKVLWPELSELIPNYGTSIDALAAIEAAIDDGVDIINFSAASPNQLENDISPGDYYFQDSFSIASYHAMANGVLVVAGAGNTGPTPSFIANFAPWMLTVGASTMDREFTCYVMLGNQQKIRAARFVDAKSNDTFYPIITGENAGIVGADLTNASYCMHGTLDPVKVKGKILVCLLDRLEDGHMEAMNKKSVTAKATGAVGVILANDKDVGSRLLPDTPHALPTAHITYKDSQTVLSYINSTRTPTALFTSTRAELGIKPAPIVPQFSSRGPNPINPEILKPDVIAPGVSIIAAYTENPDINMSPYFLESGTSMATPHVSGIAALLRKLHPHWTTSAIKSAIMTTASPLDNTKKTILEDDMVHEATPFASGAGLIQPNLAMDPGLVYDMNHYDYLNFLCSYDSASIKTFTTQHAYKCPKSFNIMDFNYPSITIPEFTGRAIATRRLKNVGQPGTYTARIQAPPGILIVVEPKTLVFTKVDQEINFKLVFSAGVNHLPTKYTFGSLVWSDGKHDVRSPIIVKGKTAPGKTPSKSPSE